MRKLGHLVCVLTLVPVLSCGGSGGSGGGGDGDGDLSSGIQVTGTVSGTTGTSLNVPLLSALTAGRADFNADPDLCPDNTGGGVSENLSPSSYTVALKRLTLLGDASQGTEDHELFPADSVDDAYVVDFADDGVFFSSESYPPAGTYNGFEIEVFYIEMEVDMIIPAVAATEASYRTRGYFAQVGNIELRDVTVFSGDAEFWINRQTDTANPYELVAVSETHPFQVLDLWSDDEFWGRDPVTISTADDFGTDFRFELADGTTGLTIPESTDELFEIELAFDVSDRFTFWEYLANGVAADADGDFTVGFDCGYRILFPNVEITVETTEADTESSET